MRALSVLQVLGSLAVVVGIFLLLPLGGALLVSGVVVLVLATAAEVAHRKALSAPPDGRSGDGTPGVA